LVWLVETFGGGSAVLSRDFEMLMDEDLKVDHPGSDLSLPGAGRKDADGHGRSEAWFVV